MFLFSKENNSKLRNNVGEPPVIYDSTLAIQTVGQMHAYLKNKGFYNNKVEFEAKQMANDKKVKLIYHIEEGKPTIISTLSYDIYPKNIDIVIRSNLDDAEIDVGERFDTETLEKERQRIAELLQNDGYFFFSSDLVYFHADTLRATRKADVTVRLKEDPIKLFSDSIKVDPYITYKIGDIFVRQDFENTVAEIMNRDTIQESGYHFLKEKAFTIRPKVITRSIFLKPYDYYTLEDHENTYRRLSGLNNYKYINISYVKSQSDDPTKMIDCVISLVPGKPWSFNMETNGTNTGGNLGINGSFSVVNRNIFKGAEFLRFGLAGGLEAQSVKSENQVVKNTPFNTVEFGPEMSLVFPKFLLPVDQNRFAKRFVPKTTFSLSYNFQKRPDYTRNIMNGALTYSWRESKTKGHAIDPFNISQTQIDKTPQFQATLDSLDNSSLKASYENNFITAMVYNFVYNNQLVQKQTKYQIFRGNIELAGNIVYFLDKNVLNSSTNEDGQYLFSNIPYSQYVRVFTEYIRSFSLNETSNFVSRSFLGIGMPYLNSTSLPFTKSFYGGGTNGIRAWQARRLGPGSIPNEFTNSAKVDQIGDIKIEQNLEYRFKVFKYLEGALFMDAGNIWVFDRPGQDERSIFKFGNLWHDLAIGTGIGARLNFNFFVIRLDVGKRIKDPGSDTPERIKFFYPNPPVYNFAIGYPF